MVSPAKFARLGLASQVRWLLRSLPELETASTPPQKLANQTRQTRQQEQFYQHYLAPIVAEQLRLGKALERQWQTWSRQLQENSPAEAAQQRRELEALLRQLCRQEPSDWERDQPGLATAHEIPPVPSQYPYLALYLDRVRSPFNVGSVFRSAHAFGVAQVWLHDHCPSLRHPRTQRSALGATALLGCGRCNQPQDEEALRRLPWLALETPQIAAQYGGVWLPELRFPTCGGLLLIGAEDTGLRPELLAYSASKENRRRGGGLLSIPMPGAQADSSAKRNAQPSLNLGVAAAIALQRWTEALQE